MHATRTRILLAAACLAAVLLAGACDTAQQVPWATYNSALQPRIDAATATRDCAALRGFLAAAKTTSHAHEKATGFPTTPSSPTSRPASTKRAARRPATDLIAASTWAVPSARALGPPLPRF
ncbi:MAG TPA: hypothetical protein VMK84_21970 [Streptosporangiaceae bacterium]|nr:hypothetical protein [Streptosporangiaceae bacterium]